jgi:DNA-directed RNA polymerase beta subunit
MVFFEMRSFEQVQEFHPNLPPIYKYTQVTDPMEIKSARVIGHWGTLYTPLSTRQYTNTVNQHSFIRSWTHLKRYILKVGPGACSRETKSASIEPPEQISAADTGTDAI